ncbi:Phosphatidylinositol phosphatase PTPRQ [Colletotrichum orbiculare MAFF 240422]|uniref:Phosphatidylinositol phosphatase PTPRQ n=1 Tax=Colletotrichum orbiculare (strain 104-T / ATCC 96160 / CBS 514.97 / LARS 414 / MAFF 240422) TaxID=1213857 RepID=N4UZD6_COLOR|nr:Phosphatidylinositol phosphatase PTPRQ [Colletotrichum orbiculare MAFF 240422]
MDHLPKFRRKPKIPTISTTDVKSPPSRNGAGIIEQDQNHQPPQQIFPSTTVTVTAGPRPPTPTKPGLRKSAFRGLHLRSSAKRARSPAPASLPSSPHAAVVSSDGIVSPPASMKHKDSFKDESSSDGDTQDSTTPKPRIPAFLDLAKPELDNKFQELVWMERNRVALGSNPEAEDYEKWGSFQPDLSRGQQDRYFNIKPWNHNRIKLRVPEDELDYVNASPIVLNSPSNEHLAPLRYIAMQGPTEPSINFVWRMIAEQLSSPVVIVQLTNFFENTQTKCHPYLPLNEMEDSWTLNEEDGWNDGWTATLTFDSFLTLEDGAIEIRKLLLRVGDDEEDRVIWHLCYTKWPDFGVPAVDDLSSFFTLMRLSREYNTAGPETPRIIHCSAGVGRTGTFITLEHLMRELDEGALLDYDASEEGEDLIYSTVNILREQRRTMVQAEAQYLFLYQVLRKLWQEKYDVEDSDVDGEPAPKRLEVEEPSTD